MKSLFHRILATLLCAQLSLPSATLEGCAARQVAGPNDFSTGDEPKELAPLRRVLQKAYVELFDLAPTLDITSAEVEAQRKALDKGEAFCVARASRITQSNMQNKSTRLRKILRFRPSA